MDQYRHRQVLPDGNEINSQWNGFKVGDLYCASGNGLGAWYVFKSHKPDSLPYVGENTRWRRLRERRYTDQMGVEWRHPDGAAHWERVTVPHPKHYGDY